MESVHQQWGLVGGAATNKLLLSSNQISMVIHVWIEVVNISYEDIRSVLVPGAHIPISRLCYFFDPIAEYIHRLGMKQSPSAALCLAYLMKYPATSLLGAHTWTKSCRPTIWPDSGF